MLLLQDVLEFQVEFVENYGNNGFLVEIAAEDSENIKFNIEYVWFN